MRFLFIFFIAFTFNFSAISQEWPSISQDDPDVPEVLKPLEEQGAQIRFMGQRGGFDGWLVFNKGVPSFTYTSGNSDVFFQGMMFDEKGTNVTLQQLQAFRLKGAGDDFDTLSEVSKLAQESQDKPKAKQEQNQNIEPRVMPAKEQEVPQKQETRQSESEDPDIAAVLDPTKPMKKSDRLMVDLRASNWVAFGQTAAPEIYALIDPLCSHCRRTMLGLKPYIDSGALEVRMIPIGFEARAKRIGSLVLAAGNGQELYYDFVSGQADNLGADESINIQGVERNLMTINAWGFDVTPMIFYRDKNSQVKIIRGVPQSFDIILKDITG